MYKDPTLGGLNPKDGTIPGVTQGGAYAHLPNTKWLPRQPRGEGAMPKGIPVAGHRRKRDASGNLVSPAEEALALPPKPSPRPPIIEQSHGPSPAAALQRRLTQMEQATLLTMNLAAFADARAKLADSQAPSNLLRVCDETIEALMRRIINFQDALVGNAASRPGVPKPATKPQIVGSQQLHPANGARMHSLAGTQ